MASKFNNNSVMTHVEHCEATLKSLENEEANTQFETSLFSCDDPYTPVVDNISKRSKSDGALNNNNGSQFLKKMDELRRSQSMFDTLGHNSNKKMERGDFDDSMSESSNDAWYEKEIVMHHRTMSPDTTPEPMSSPSIGVRINKSNKSNHNVKVNNHFRMKNQWNLNNTYDMNDEEMSDSSMNEDDMVMNVHGRSKSDGLLLRPSGLLAGEFSENDAAIKKVAKIDGNESDSAVSVSSSDSSVLASDYLSSGSEGRKGRMARSRAGLYSSSRAIAAAAAPYQHEEQHHQQASRKEQEKECKDDANNNKEERWFTKGESILENIALLQKLVGFLSFLVVFMFFMQANMMNQMNQFGAKQDEILNFMGKRGFGCQYDFNDVFSSNNFIELLPIASGSASASATVTTSTHIHTSKNKRETRTEKVTRIELVGEDNGEDSKNDWGLITEYVSNVMKITSLTFPITIPTFETQNEKAPNNADDKENAQNEDSSKNDTLAYSSLFAELSPYMIIAPNVLKNVLASKEETRTVEEAATRSEIEERSENTSSNVSDESENFSNYYLKNDGNTNNGEESILSFADDMGLYNNSYHEMNNEDTIVLVDEASNYFEESNDGDNGESDDDDDAYHGDNDDFESFYESDDNEEDDDRMDDDDEYDDNEDERENDGERKEMARYRNEQVSTLAVLQDEKNKHEKRKQQLAHLAHEKEMKTIQRATATQSRNDEKIQDNSQNVGQDVFSSMNKNQMIQNADAAVVEQMSFVSFEQSEENDKDKQEWQSFDENQSSNNSEKEFLFERDSQKQETMKQQNDNENSENNENSGQQENQENNQNKNDNQQSHGGSSSGYGKADSSMTQSKNLQNAIDDLDSKIQGRILLLSLNENTMVFAKRNDENETQDSIKIIDAAPQGSENGGEQSVTQTVIQLNNRFANLSRNCDLTFRNDIGLGKQFGDRFESMYTHLNQNDKMQMQFAGSPDLFKPIKQQLELPRLLQLPQLPQQFAQLAQLAQGNAVAKAQDEHEQQLEQQQQQQAQQQEQARVLGQKQSRIENVSRLQSKMQELIETIEDQNNKMQNEIQSISGELFCHDENVKQLSCDCEEDLDCMNGILGNVVNESGFSYSSQLVKSLELLKMNMAPWELLKQIDSDNDNKIDNFMNQNYQIYQSSMFSNDYNNNNNKRQHRMRFQRYVKFGKFGNDDKSNKNSNANWNSIFENLKSLIKRCLNFEFQDMVAWTLGIYSVIPQRWSKCSSL